VQAAIVDTQPISRISHAVRPARGANLAARIPAKSGLIDPALEKHCLRRDKAQA
jgi:hypothetical protein